MTKSFTVPGQPRFWDPELDGFDSSIVVTPSIPNDKSLLPPPQLPPRVMPPRSQNTNTDYLPLLFDLPEDERANLQVSKPPATDRALNGEEKNPGRHSRIMWPPVQIDYLNELMELAMLILNRPLRQHDFPAIAEAMNRRFRGTGIDGVAYRERGFQTVYARAMRMSGYKKFVERILR